MNAHLRYLLATTAISLFAAPSFAQDQQSDAEDSERTLDAVVIVGSQIKGVDITAALPVTVLNAADLEATNATTFEELLLDLPQAGAADFNSGAQLSNDARGDIASLNLRSIGADTSLVLVNGRRVVAHPQTQTFGGVPIQFVNVNAIPTSGLGRIEVLRDGASALYGSDAVAGVLNAIIDTDFEGLTATARVDTTDNADLTQYRFGLRGGKSFNDGATNLSFSVSYFDRSLLEASERSFSANADKRFDSRLPDAFRNPPDFSFRNNSSFTRFGEFQVGTSNSDSDFFGGQAVSIQLADGTIAPLSAGSGGFFHLQPTGGVGTLPETPFFAGGFANPSQSGFAFAPGLELDDGTSTSTSLTTGNGIVNDLGFVVSPTRFNQNIERALLPEVQRVNVALAFEHEFNNGWEIFGDGIYFHSDSSGFFAAPVLSTSNNFTIPETYFFNPFGALTLADGSANPNRLAGLIDVPDEGLQIQVNRFRFTETPRRNIDVNIDQFRALTGIRGELFGWDVESAFGYSESSARDVGNLVSRSLLFEELSRTDAGAFNIFSGPENLDPEGVSRFSVDVVRQSRNTLATGDIRVSNPAVFALPAGDIAVGSGLEWRRESVNDDRDDRLDGTITFTNPLSGEFFDSDLLGVSATDDFSANRNVISGYAEVIIPLLRDLPLVDSLTVQAAGRFEYFDDLSTTAVTPRISASWFITDWLQARGSWSEGFRAPNLVQSQTPSFTRFTNSQVDFTRETTQGQSEAIAVESLISGNPDLTPEDSENFSVGITLEPPIIEGLTLTVDYWDIQQDGTVGTLGRNDEIALDEFLFRTTGVGNPNVVRGDASAEDIAATAAFNLANGTSFAAVGDIIVSNEQFLNLGTRSTAGVDIGVFYDFPTTSLGDFSVNFNIAYLDDFTTESFDFILDALTDPIAAGNFDASAAGENTAGVGTLAEWRFQFSARWEKGPWDAGISGRFVGETIDDGEVATIDGELEFFEIDSFFSLDLFGAYEFEEGLLGGTRIRAGVRNLFDEDPPLFDNSAGFSGASASPVGRQFFLSATYDF